jgi:acetyltransferase
MARFTQIDYDREMAFIATAPNATGDPETLGVVRTVTDSANQRAEFAIIVRSNMKGRGLGSALMSKMIRYTKARQTPLLCGQLLAENQPMRRFLAGLGFKLRALPEDLQVMEATLDLKSN